MRPVQISDLTTESVKLSCQTAVQTLIGQPTWLEHSKLAGKKAGGSGVKNSDADGKSGRGACDQAKESLPADKLKSGHAGTRAAKEAKDNQSGRGDSGAKTSHLKTVEHKRPRGMTRSAWRRKTRPTQVTQSARTTWTQHHGRGTGRQAWPRPVTRAQGEHHQSGVIRMMGEGSPKAHSSQGERQCANSGGQPWETLIDAKRTTLG